MTETFPLGVATTFGERTSVLSIGQRVTRRPLPLWTSFFWDLGATLAATDDKGWTIVTSVPDRRFSAVLAAAGCCLQLGWAALHGAGSPMDHYAHLSTLGGSTPVTWIRGERVVHGRLVGSEQRDNERFLLLKETGGGDIILPAHLCGTVAEEASDEAARSAARSARASQLVAALIGGNVALGYSRLNGPQCAVVGPVKTLQAEFHLPFLWVDDTTEPFRLQDVVRAVKADDLKPRNLTVMYPGSRPMPPIRSRVPVVILDGSDAYVRHRRSWPEANILVVVDRSSPRADSAELALRQTRARAGVATAVLPQEIRVPDGIEIVCLRSCP